MPRPIGSQVQLEKRRRRAIELLDGGLSPLEVSRKLGCTRRVIYTWRKAFRQQGMRGLRARPAGRRPAKLTPSQKSQLNRILLAGPLKAGYSTDLWTQKRVAQVIRDRFGVDYHSNHMWRFLQHLGWSVQKPEKRARERDEKAIAHWKRHAWPHIKKV